MIEKEKKILTAWAGDFGLVLSAHQMELLGLYVDELWEWNRKFSLTGLSSRKKIISELLIDSLIPAAFLPHEGRFLDVGSGAGFPAIPLKICKPRLEAQLLEANARKVSFLKQVIRITRLHGIYVARGRIEKNRRLLNPEGYHIITARALAPLPHTLRWCASHLADRGMIVSFQGAQFKKQLDESSHVMKEHRIFLQTSIPYTLPGKDSPRNLLIFAKGL